MQMILDAWRHWADTLGAPRSADAVCWSETASAPRQPASPFAPSLSPLP